MKRFSLILLATIFIVSGCSSASPGLDAEAETPKSNTEKEKTKGTKEKEEAPEATTAESPSGDRTITYDTNVVSSEELERLKELGIKGIPDLNGEAFPEGGETTVFGDEKQKNNFYLFKAKTDQTVGSSDEIWEGRNFVLFQSTTLPNGTVTPYHEVKRFSAAFSGGSFKSEGEVAGEVEGHYLRDAYLFENSLYLLYANGDLKSVFDDNLVSSLIVTKQDYQEDGQFTEADIVANVALVNPGFPGGRVIPTTDGPALKNIHQSKFVMLDGSNHTWEWNKAMPPGKQIAYVHHENGKVEYVLGAGHIDGDQAALGEWVEAPAAFDVISESGEGLVFEHTLDMAAYDAFRVLGSDQKGHLYGLGVYTDGRGAFLHEFAPEQSWNEVNSTQVEIDDFESNTLSDGFMVWGKTEGKFVPFSTQ